MTANRQSRRAGFPNPDSLNRIRAEYREMPGLSLTQAQMQRLFGFDAEMCAAAVERLVEVGVLRRTTSGRYIAG